MNYISVWEEKYSLLLYDFALRSYIKHADVIGNNISDAFIYAENQGVGRAYDNSGQHKIVLKEHGEYFLNPANKSKMLGAYEQIRKEHQELIKQFSKTNFRNLSVKKLAAYFEAYSQFAIKTIAYFRAARPELEIGPERELRKELKGCYLDKKERQRAFNIITTATASDPIKEEARDWLSLVRLPAPSEKIFAKHARKYPWLFMGVYSPKKAVAILTKKYSEDKRHINQLEQTQARSEWQIKDVRNRQKKIYAHCGHNKRMRYLASIFQDIGVKRFFIKPIWAGMELYGVDLFDEIARRINIDTDDLLETYTDPEIKGFLYEGTALASEEMRRRKEFVVLRLKNNIIAVFSGESARKFIQEMIQDETEKSVTELKGMAGNSGIARGLAKVFEATGVEGLHKQAQKKNYQKGDILVSVFTQPNMIFLIRKAAAIVTDGGGITSHAAIVSREFGLPSVLGTKNATKVLKDGDLIEVNGDEGVIRILKRAL